MFDWDVATFWRTYLIIIYGKTANGCIFSFETERKEIAFFSRSANSHFSVNVIRRFSFVAQIILQTFAITTIMLSCIACPLFNHLTMSNFNKLTKKNQYLFIWVADKKTRRNGFCDADAFYTGFHKCLTIQHLIQNQLEKKISKL